MKGTLKIRVIDATILTEKDSITLMDPYVVIKLGSQSFKTTVAKNMGVNPVWNEEFVFNMGSHDQLKISVYDSDIGKDDFIGYFKITIDQLSPNLLGENYFPLVSSILHSERGRIHVVLDFIPFILHHNEDSMVQNDEKIQATNLQEGSSQQGLPF